MYLFFLARNFFLLTGWEKTDTNYIRYNGKIFYIKYTGIIFLYHFFTLHCCKKRKLKLWIILKKWVLG